MSEHMARFCKLLREAKEDESKATGMYADIDTALTDYIENLPGFTSKEAEQKLVEERLALEEIRDEEGKHENIVSLMWNQHCSGKKDV